MKSYLRGAVGAGPGIALGLVLAMGLPLVAWGADASPLPSPASVKIDYDRDIRPLFEASCFRCHGPEKPKSKFRLDDRAAALKGGSYGVAIIPGNSAESPLVHVIARLDEDKSMPPEGKGEKLTAEQVALVRAWIDQGAVYSGNASAQPAFQYSIEPALQWVHVEGNEGKFREHAWMEEGWDGGMQSLRLRETYQNGVKLDVEAESRFASPRHRVQFSLEKEDVGFLRGGIQQLRKYYSDAGGFSETGGIAPMALGEDWHLDSGRAWIELGLTLPDLPRFVFGYEYRFRDGRKSSLAWGPVSAAGGDAYSVYPASRKIDEQTHIVRFEMSYDWDGLQIDNRFRAEFLDLNNEKVWSDFFQVGDPAPLGMTRIRDPYEHTQAVNAFRLEKWIREEWMVSGGYYFSRLDGEAGFSQETFLPNDPTQPPFLGLSSRQIVLDQTAHVLNANTQLGSWQDLTFTAGLQSEWMRQHGIGSGLDGGGFPVTIGGNIDRQVTEERLGLRYTALPATVVFADSRFQQERIGSFESEFFDDGVDLESDFMRDTDARDDLKEYRAGFVVSPWTRLSWHNSVRHRLKQNDYDFHTDADRGVLPGNGYPSAITSRDIATDEIESKLVVHWASRFKTTFKYQLVATDYRTVLAPVTDPATGVAGGGGGLAAGNYDAHIYSVMASATPWRRLHLSSTLVFSESRLRHGLAGQAGLPDYRGEAWSALGSATFVVSEKMDWTASYSFSKADYGEDNYADGFPLGMVYDRHGLLVGLSQKLGKQWTARLQYGYFEYREPRAAGRFDYTAHAVFASLAWNLP